MPRIRTHTHTWGEGEGSERMRKSNSHVLNLLSLLVVAAHTLAHTDTLTVIHTPTHTPFELCYLILYLGLFALAAHLPKTSIVKHDTRLHSPRLVTHALTHTHLHPLCWQFELLAVALTANNCWWPKGCRSRNEIAVKRTWPRFRVD